MRRDFTADYISEAFRLYAIFGQPDKKTMLNMDFKEVESPYRHAIFDDLFAVCETLEHFKRSGKEHINKAIEDVYFFRADKELQKGEINARVVGFAVDNYVSERNVWRWLKEARKVCALYRGLNTVTACDVIKKITASN